MKENQGPYLQFISCFDKLAIWCQFIFIIMYFPNTGRKAYVFKLQPENVD